MLRYEECEYFCKSLYTSLIVQDSCEAADDSLLDLVDYCHRKLTLLASEATKDCAVAYGQQNQISSIEVKLNASQFILLSLPR